MKGYVVILKDKREINEVTGNLSLGQLQGYVNGRIEIVSITPLFKNPAREIDMIINEEGKLEGLPINVVASIMAIDARSISDDVIVGPAVFAACDDDGNSVPLTHDELVELEYIIMEATVKASYIVSVVDQMAEDTDK